jgi:hypothetical protein
MINIIIGNWKSEIFVMVKKNEIVKINLGFSKKNVILYIHLPNLCVNRCRDINLVRLVFFVY